MSEKDWDTSIPLKKEFFELIKSGEKTIHIDKSDRGLTFNCGVIRFMNGYDPSNGSVLRRIFRMEHKQVREIDVYELCEAQVSVSWLLDYVDNKIGKYVYLYILEGK